MAVRISGVEPGSACDGKGVAAGHMLISINGNTVNDVLDYRFYMAERVLSLSLEDSSGNRYAVKIRKPEFSDMGLLFGTYLMDEEKSCKNKCCFCFIDQLPAGLRESLYFKDDDSRLGFLFGNYITLTNLGDNDIIRIIKMRISPVNISVHTMNPGLRVQMMKNPRAGEALRFLPMLARAGIKINVQLVLCPGINDDKELHYSLERLMELGESLLSCSCVPVGLTKHREGLPELRLFTAAESREVIMAANSYGDRALKKYGRRVFFCSDEFYLSAGFPMPDHAWYEDFCQLENGVGMSALLEREFTLALGEGTKAGGAQKREITIATGKLAYPLIKRLAGLACEGYPGLSVNVEPLTNIFFGESITVSGLLTGSDIIAQLKGKPLGQELLFPSSMLRHDGDLFLDGVSVGELQEALETPVRAVENDGFALLRAVLG